MPAWRPHTDSQLSCGRAPEIACLLHKVGAASKQSAANAAVSETRWRWGARACVPGFLHTLMLSRQRQQQLTSWLQAKNPAVVLTTIVGHDCMCKQTVLGTYHQLTVFRSR